MDKESADQNKADERTDLAEDRTVQATERTFFGALRTAFGAIGVGIAFHVFFGDFQPPWLARGIATVFMVLAAAIAFLAERRARESFKHLSTHEIESVQGPRIKAMSWAVIVAAAILIVGLWILRDESSNANAAEKVSTSMGSGGDLDVRSISEPLQVNTGMRRLLPHRKRRVYLSVASW